MSMMRVTAAQILADCPLVVGFGGWGVLGSELPATGEHGPSVGYQWIDPIADANKEIWVRITTEPSAGTLLMWPDSSFEYDGPSTTFEAQLAVDAMDVSTPQTVTVTVGATTSVSSDLDLEYEISGGVVSDLWVAWDILTSAQADLSLSYTILSSASSDISLSYPIRAQVIKDLPLSYPIVTSVDGDLILVYAIGEQSSADGKFFLGAFDPDVFSPDAFLPDRFLV